MWVLIKNSSDGAQNFIQVLSVYDDIDKAEMVALELNYNLGTEYLEFYVQSFPKNFSYTEILVHLTLY